MSTGTELEVAMQVVAQRDLTAAEAREITERIKSSMEGLMCDVVTVHRGRAWIALDYPSWDDYIRGEFEYAPLAGLPREERKAVVALLHGSGMSKRAIAPVVGVDRQTVANDLAGGENSPPDDVVQVTGLDGKHYPAGKPRPAAQKTSNELLKQFYRSLSQLQDHALKLESLCNKPEFAAHLDQLYREHHGGIAWAQEIVGRVLDQLGTIEIELLVGGD
jgi:hypothetical protein